MISRDEQPWGVHMTGFESVRRLQENEPPNIGGRVLLTRLVWVTGLVSTIYLIAYSSFLTFLAVGFGSSLARTDTLGYLALVGRDSIPLVSYAAIGITGLRVLSSGRFWRVGLAAILLETALAIYVLASPGSIPMFEGWLL